MIIIPSITRLAERLRSAKRAAKTNPPRAPELEAVYQQLDQWAGKDMNWLTENAKMEKPVKGQRWEIRGISFMSAGMAKKLVRLDPSKWGLKAEEVDQLQNVCPGATAGCMAVCLVDAGQMGLPAAKSAQLRRQLAFTFKRDAFFTMVTIAIARLYAFARKHGKKTGIRLNVTSDLDWENIPVTIDPWLAKYLSRNIDVKPGTYRCICDVFPKVLFYDYTKVEPRMEKYLQGRDWPANYKLTWSLAETPRNRLMAIRYLDAKAGSLSVPFDIVGARGKDKEKRTPPLPQTLTIVDNSPGREPVPHTYPVINADEHDLRPMDPPGSVAGLKFKIPRPKRLVGTTVAQKIHAGGEFIVKTGGSMHPVISVYRSWGGAQTNPGVPFTGYGDVRRALAEAARRRRAAAAGAATVRVTRRSNPRWRRRR